MADMTSSEIIHLNDENFKDVINNATKPVVVDFWAQWCGPCKFFAPIFEEIAAERKDKMIFAKVNVDEAQTTAVENNIRSIPTLLVFEKGESVMGLVGSAAKDVLLEKLDSFL